MMDLVLMEWRGVQKNSLRGFATIKFPSGMIMHDISVHLTNGTIWASPPSKPMLDRDGRQMKDDAGKTKWTPIISFSNRAVRERWSELVVSAVRQAHPEALREAPQDADAYA